MFTREDTKYLKGIAILLMLIHHLWGFPERLPIAMQITSSKDTIHGINIFFYLGTFGKICVAIFMFLGGYGLWKKHKQTSYSLATDIIRLYKSMWKIWFIFIPIGLVFFSEQPDYSSDSSICHVFADKSTYSILSSFTGISSLYNHEWWFFLTYLSAMVLGYVFIYLMRNCTNFWCEATIILLVEISTQRFIPTVSDALPYLREDWFYNIFISIDPSVCIFFIGIVFGKYNGIEKLNDLFTTAIPVTIERLIVSIGGIALIIMCRNFYFGNGLFDILYIPFFIVFIINLLDKSIIIKKFFKYLGKNSTNTWLIHSFYCYYYYPIVRLVCASKNALISLTTLLGLSLFSSILIDAFWKYTRKFVSKAETYILMRRNYI